MVGPRSIALFGGTFDPVHAGHVHLAAAAREALGLDEVRFIPCRISPHKAGSEPTPAAERLEMLRLATAELPWAVVDETEVRREGLSYSWQTAEEMKARFPDARLYWIMGADQWRALGDWARPERLAACVEFVVFARGESPQPRDGYVLHALEGGHPASATEIRRAIAAGGMPGRWLHPAVARHIARSGLYQA